MPHRRAFVGGWREGATLAVAAPLLVGLGALLGLQVGKWLANGFRFDWYVHVPIAHLDATALAWWAARVAAASALVASAAALLVLFALHRPSPRPRFVPESARTRAGHALLHVLCVPAAAALIMAEIFWIGGGGWSRERYVPLLGMVGAVAAGGSFLVTWFATRRGLARGMIVAPAAGETLVGSIMLRAARHPRGVLGVILVLSLVAGYGTATLTADVDVVDVLPRGDPNTEAAHNLTERFKSSFTLQATLHVRVNPQQQPIDEAAHLPHRMTERTPHNITDEVYVRAMDEMVQFIKHYVPPGHEEPPFRSSVALPSFYRLINWTFSGGRDAPDAAYTLPTADSPNEAGRYALVHDGVWRHIPDAATALLSPDFEQAALLFMVSPDEPLTSQEVGRAALQAREAYVAWAESRPDAYKVFTGSNAPLFTVDIPVANAHQSELAKRDFQLLLPVIAIFIAASLWMQFRDARVIAIAFTTLGVAVLWTFGIMGFVGLPLNTVNLTVVPLILGVGIDYGIHVLNEYQHGRSTGLSSVEAFRKVGARSGLSLFIATTTSILGVAVMIVSPSLLIAQLGFLCCVALAFTYLLTVTLIPSGCAFLEPPVARHVYRPSPLMGGAARAIGRHRLLMLAVIVLVLAASYASSLRIETEPFGDPPRNWLQDDPLRQEHERAGKGFYASSTPDAKANVLVFEGDVMHPDAHRYMDALEGALREQPRVVDHTLRTVPFMMRTYLAVRDGIPGAAQYTLFHEMAQRTQAQQMDPYPTTREGIVALAEEAHATPLREFADLFYAWPDPSIAVMTFTTRAATFEDAVEVWDEVWAAVAEAESMRPPDLQVSFVGNTATNYLFVQKQVPWLHKMAPVVAVSVVALVILLTRDIKAAAVVGVHNLFTGIIWFGLLPQLGIGLSITLTLPLIFIFALGSDYALHLSMACRHDDTEAVFRTTGKAILFSAVTTLGAFALFAQVSNLAVQRAMVATAAAVAALFLVTTIMVPVLYPPDRAPRVRVEPEGSEAPELERVGLAP